MSRKDRDDSIWLSEHSDKRRIRDAENARRNRAEITQALSHGQIRRRDLVKWGLFTSAGLMLPIGGLNPFVRYAAGPGVITECYPCGPVRQPGNPYGTTRKSHFWCKAVYPADAAFRRSGAQCSVNLNPRAAGDVQPDAAAG